MEKTIKVISSDDLESSCSYVIKSIASVTSGLNCKNYIIAPDRYSLIVENMMFSALDKKAVFSVQVKGISSLAREIFEDLGIDKITFTKNESLLAVRKAISDTLKNFVCFKKNVTMDFCSEIYNTISQLQSNEITPDDLRESILDSKGGLKNKLQDILIIYERYLEILNGKLDSSAIYSLLIEKAKVSPLVNNSNFYFVGFDALTKQGYSLLKVLANNCKNLTVGVVKKSSYKNSYICDEELYLRLKQFESEGFKIEEESFEDTSSEFSKHIKKNLFLSKTQKQEFDGAFSLLEASNMTIEITKLVKIIKSLIKSGYRYKDINVVCGSASYVKEIEKEFTENNIIHYIDDDIKLSSLSFAKMIICALEFFNNPYFTEKLFDAIELDLLDIDESHLFNLRNLTDKYGFNGIDLLYSDIKDENLSSTITKIKDIHKSLTECKKTQDYVEWTKNLLLLSNAELKLEEILSYFKNSYDIKSEKIYIQALQKINECLDSFAILDDENISLSEFVDLVRYGFENFKISSVPASVDNIYVGNAENSFFERRKVLFVVGANQNSLPITLNDLGLISDKDIDSLYKIEINPTVSMINRRNRYKLYDILSKAQEKLILSYTNTTDDGKSAYLANFANQLKNAFLNKDGKSVEIEYSVYDSVYLPNLEKSENLNKLISNAHSLLSAKKEFFKLRKNQLSFNQQQILFTTIKKLDSNFNYEIKENEKKYLNSDAKSVFFPYQSTKISQLEKYFECPYKHFIEYGLKLKENETSSLDAKIFGTILHSIAENFVKQNTDRLVSLLDDEIEQIVEGYFSQILLDSNYKRFTYSQENRLILYLIKKEAIAFCKELCRQQKLSSFAPKYFEKKLSADMFNIDGFKLSIKGVVDRIDLCDNYFRIIDYKSGKIDSSFSALYYGNKVQLFIYQKLVRKWLNKTPAGLFYYSIKNFYEKDEDKPFGMQGIVLDNFKVATLMDSSFDVTNQKSELLKVALSKTSLKSGELKLKGKNLATIQEFKILEDYAYNVCKLASREILSGYIKPSPITDACKYCEYRAGCGFDETNGGKIRKEPSISKKDIIELNLSLEVENE